MPEIQDVLDKLDDVLDKINDVQEKVGELEAKINEVQADLAEEIVKLTCPACNGTGYKIDYPGPPQPGEPIPPPVSSQCERCGGTGRVIAGEVI